jgi:hypothetical protein
MMLSGLDGDGKIGVAVVGTDPGAVDGKLRRWIGKERPRAGVMD